MARPDNNKPYGERILQLEDPMLEGRDVWELQIKLIGWGSGSDNDGIGTIMDPVRITGKFNTTTRDAVMRFQKAHQLTVTGVADAVLFRAIDRELALHPVTVHDLKCPCVRGDNDGPVLCRCRKAHDYDGKSKKCDGFGLKRFSGKSLLDGKKLADDSDINGEPKELYDMEEYDGMDKALLWAVRAILRRSGVQKADSFKPIQIVSGYRCWNDNYHHTDETRWHHRRSTFHFGKAVEFFIGGYERDFSDYHCGHRGWKDNIPSCRQCNAIRKTATETCGFQLRWQEPERVSVAEGSKKACPPSTPFSVHIDTVRRKDRESDDFVDTDLDAGLPDYKDKINTVLYPVDLKEGTNPRTASSLKYFEEVEKGPGGWYPLGASRLWHSGVHFYANAGTEIRAIADGEVIGCRVGENEDAHPYGSRNFVLVKHSLKGKGNWKDKVFYALYMHLDGEQASEEAKASWRRQLYLKSKSHVEAKAPCPLFKLVKKKVGDAKGRLFTTDGGIASGERIEVTGGEANVDGFTVDYPADTYKAVAVAGMDATYVFTKRDDEDMAELKEADDTLADKFNAHDVIGLEEGIKICAGDVLGKVGKTPTDDSLKTQGSFFHLETFAEKELPVGKGFVKIDVGDEKEIVDREKVVEALVGQKLLPEVEKSMLRDKELKKVISKGTYKNGLRNAVLNCKNLWSLDWEKTLKGPKCYSFMKDDDRDKLGEAMNEYSWWKEVKDGKGKLPASETVYHYHPIALILQIAYS